LDSVLKPIRLNNSIPEKLEEEKVGGKVYVKPYTTIKNISPKKS
jgi:hypothetical protein